MHINDSTRTKSRKALHEAVPAIDKFARAGYLAKGTVYIMIGALAMMTAIGHRKETTDTKGAIETIGAQPLGGILLLILAVGLAGFSTWRLVQAFADPDGEGGDGKGILVRASRFCGGIFYAVITYHAAKTILGARPSSDNSEQALTAVLLQQPLGASLIAAAGLGFAIYGIIEFVKAIRNSFTNSFKLNEIKPAMYRYLVATAKFGLCARGVVFGLIGYFLVRTAVFSDPEETKGLDDALAELALQPHGRWLLGAAALGFVAYGLYMFGLARYRKTIGKKRER
ncbi:protein of unknown function [Cohnella sp. OV330]|nr:protein of unknown function [Cohnella sp. OV330]